MTGATYLRFGDVRWHVRGDVADLLFNADGLRLPHWIKSGQARIVKHGPHRTVYHVQLDDRSIYIKHNRVPDIRAVLSQWVQTSKGRRELNCIEKLAAASVPTIAPLALGEQRKAGLVLENYLVTEAIENVLSLDRFVQETWPKLSAEAQPRLRLNLTRSLAELVARLHRAGATHPDLHSGNILVRVNSDHTVALFLVDLQEAGSVRSVGWRQSRDDLLAFGLFFLTMGREIDRARFLRRYLELRPELQLNWKTKARELEQALRLTARRFWRKLDYRCVTNNRRFLYRNSGQAHGHAVSEIGNAMLWTLLRDPDAPLKTGSAQVLKRSPSSEVVRLSMPLAGAATEVVYKRFNCPKPLDALRATVHHSPALRAWHAGHGLLIRRIPTPRPLAVIERTPGLLIRETYLLSQFIPNSRSLKDYVADLAASGPAGVRQHRLRALIFQLAELVRRMHERSISHRDMKASNFLIAPGSEGTGSIEIYLIDLAGAQIWRRLPQKRRLQNLARILVSLQSFAVFTRSDFLRFLFAYQPGVRGNRDLWKPIWRTLSQSAANKIARNQQRNRPVA